MRQPGGLVPDKARRMRLAAPQAHGLPPARAGILIEADAKLRGTLEHMKELAERQPDQRRVEQEVIRRRHHAHVGPQSGLTLQRGAAGGG